MPTARNGEVRFGDISSEPAAGIDGQQAFQARSQVPFHHEASPTAYGLYRQVVELGHDCMVMAPSLVPKRAGDWPKTGRNERHVRARVLPLISNASSGYISAKADRPFHSHGLDLTRLDKVSGDGPAQLLDDGSIEITFAYRNGDQAILEAKPETSSTACFR